jgi:tetratricopeptide (TPR) repeat protein
MLPDLPWRAILRTLLAVILIALLNLAPRPHAFRQGLDQASQAIQRSDYATALNQTTIAAEQIPWRFDLPLLSARLALQSGNHLQAIQILEQPHIASQLAPADLLILGDAYQQSGDTLMAAAIWQRVVELAPSPEIYQRLAEHHQARQDYPAAIEDLRHMLQYNPADADLNYRIGLLYSTVDPESALAYLAQAAELDPDLASGALELQRKIRTATLFDEPAYTFTSVGRVLALLDEWNLAEAAFRNATRLRSDYAEAWAFLGEARQHSPAASSGEYAGLAELQQALRLDPNSVSANLLMGLYWSRQGDPKLAASYIQKTLIIEPDNPLLHAELGNALAQQGNLPTAEAAYRQAISLAPDDPLFYRLLAEFSLTNRIQVRQIALPAARTAVILNPEEPRSLDLLGHVLLILEDYQSAERFLLKALQIDPDYAPAHLHLGMILLQRNEMQRAREEFDLAKTLGSDTWTITQAQRFISYYYP